MSVNQIRMIRGPYKGRVHDVQPYVSGSCATLRQGEARTLLETGWAEPVAEAAPERAVKAPAKRKAVKPAAKRKAGPKKKKK